MRWLLLAAVALAWLPGAAAFEVEAPWWVGEVAPGSDGVPFQVTVRAGCFEVPGAQDAEASVSFTVPPGFHVQGPASIRLARTTCLQDPANGRLEGTADYKGTVDMGVRPYEKVTLWLDVGVAGKTERTRVNATAGFLGRIQAVAAATVATDRQEVAQIAVRSQSSWDVTVGVAVESPANDVLGKAGLLVVQPTLDLPYSPDPTAGSAGNVSVTFLPYRTGALDVRLRLTPFTRTSPDQEVAGEPVTVDLHFPGTGTAGTTREAWGPAAAATGLLLCAVAAARRRPT